MAEQQTEAIKNLFDEAAGSFLISDAHGTALYANRAVAYRTGYTTGETVGKKPGRLWGGNMPRDFYAALWTTITQGAPFTDEVCNIKKNGEQLREHVNIIPVLNERRVPVLFLELKPAHSAVAHIMAHELEELKWQLVYEPGVALRRLLTRMAGHALGEREECALTDGAAVGPGAVPSPGSAVAFFETVFIAPVRHAYRLRQEDAVLVARAQAEPAAFEALYKKYYRQIFRYFYMRLGTEQHLADDYAQEVFMRAFGSMGAFEMQNASYLTYLMRVAHNTLVNHFRKQRAAPRVDETEQVPNSAHPQAPMSSVSAAGEIAAALDTLHPRQRRAVEMMYFEGLSVREIACLMNKSENAVKLDLSRARKKLKEIIT